MLDFVLREIGIKCDGCDEIKELGVSLNKPPHRLVLCTNCLADALEKATGYRVTKMLAAWRYTSQAGAEIRAAKAAERKGLR